MDKVPFFNTRINQISKLEFYQTIINWAKVRESKSVFFANVHMLVETNVSKEFKYFFDNADITLTDGMPLVFSLKLLYGIEQERIAGMDAMSQVFKLANREGINVFLYGSTETILQSIIERSTDENQGLNVQGFSPPFRELTKEENDNVISLISNSDAGIVMVALGCPKQEKWISQMKGKISAVMLGLGGAFPVYAFAQERAPLWMQQVGLEWLFRLLQEPRRLWKRYIITNSKFICLVLLEVIKQTSKYFKRTNRP